MRDRRDQRDTAARAPHAPTRCAGARAHTPARCPAAAPARARPRSQTAPSWCALHVMTSGGAALLVTVMRILFNGNQVSRHKAAVFLQSVMMPV